ncbi:MAG: SDR family oxidoreductase [Solirubrobacterales bacterium]
MDLGLDGKVALVLGASRGIGRGIAGSLAREGAHVAIASRSAERIEATAAELSEETSVAVEPLSADTDDLERLAELPGEVAERIGPVEILVTNTGGPPPGGMLDHDLDDWERAYRSLVLAPRVLAEAVLPGMRERSWGRIVNVGSTSTREVIPGLGLSNVHRPAATATFKALAREVAADGITVNTVATGRIATERLVELSGSMEAVEERARIDVPAARLGTADEYGDLVAFVCSERAGYLTGTEIPLDGGLLRSV